MFSGIIQATGKVNAIEISGSTIRIQVTSPISAGLHIDQSVSHDGICLTVVKVENDSHWVEIVKETQSKTTFGSLKKDQLINLETSVTLNTLLDGHLVQGHVDTTLKCLELRDEQGSWNIKFNLPGEFTNLVIPRGSICLNGVSLTIANLFDHSFEVAIIPYTYHHTNFQHLKPGDEVNAEFDLIGKYLLRQVKS